MKGHPIAWTEEELAFLANAQQGMTRRALHQAFVARFARDEVSLDAVKQLCFRKGWRTGRTGCFEKGAEPANKGKTCPEGTGGRHPNARRTQFKKGGRTGAAQRNYQPIGAERVSKEGYLERKVHDGLPMQSRWQTVQRIRWEAENGPLAEGHVLKCLDGNRRNTDPSNWIDVPRALLPRLNGRFGRDYEAAPAELKPIIMKIAQLEHAARERRKARTA